MEVKMENVTSLWDQLMKNVPTAVEALILLIIAFICASIVKNLVANALDFLKIDKALDKAEIDKERKTNLKEFISKIFYLITFILFVPGIFEKLGLKNVSEPITNMMNKFMGYLPNIVASIVLFIVGVLIAKVVKELLIPLFKSLKIDSYIEKLGFKKDEKVALSEMLANLVYVFILIPIIIASLDALKVEAISKPAIEMLNTIIVFIPRVAVAIVILFVGKYIADLVENLLEKLLVSIGTDRIANKALSASATKTSKDFSLSKTIAYAVKYIMIIFFLVEGLDILELDILTNIGNEIIKYMPYAISSAIILGITILVANYVENTIRNKFTDSKATALIVKIVIIVVGTFITLYQLGIAKEMINSAFIILLSAFAVAFAISFGVGGREFASHMLKKVETKIDSKSKK